jgi:5'-phosphate synthase pdxT subunit
LRWKNTQGEQRANLQENPDLTEGRTLPRIGVLAIQGDYAAHAEALAEAGAIPVEVRKAGELAGLDGLILPGGESTTLLRFLGKHRFFEHRLWHLRGRDSAGAGGSQSASTLLGGV